MQSIHVFLTVSDDALACVNLFEVELDKSIGKRRRKIDNWGGGIFI